jgi:hypothetical protein
MFQVHCPAHRSRVLLTTRRITVLLNTGAGVVVQWRCWCGHVGRSLMSSSLAGHDDERGGEGTDCPDCPDGTWPAAS